MKPSFHQIYFLLSIPFQYTPLCHSFNLNVNKRKYSLYKIFAKKVDFGIDDEFDPLLSPHMYPNGIRNDKSSKLSKDLTFSSPKSKEPIDIDVFDPRISPHAYSKGISSYNVSVQSLSSSNSKSKIGILLIDHGSKRPKSNEFLETIASAYQKTCPEHIVKACHMEIASPSIYDGICNLVQKYNVNQIVCHPFFLSPGKHATEDVPALIQEAREKLVQENISNVNIIMTDPLGSHVDLMVKVIRMAVENKISKENLLDDEEDHQSSNEGELSGIFGDIQRQLEQM